MLVNLVDKLNQDCVLTMDTLVFMGVTTHGKHRVFLEIMSVMDFDLYSVYPASQRQATAP